MVAIVYIVFSAFLFNEPVLIPDSVVRADTIKVKETPASLTKLLEQSKKQLLETEEPEMELDGLLVDMTKTKGGKDFYDLFYNSWEPPQAAKNFTITISEKPNRLNTTFIVVSINENVVYENILQPRLDIIEYMKEEAIAATQSYLANYEEIMRELNGDDLSGSGIY